VSVAVAAGAYLHHIELESGDPAALADFYGRAMDMSVERQGADRWICRGPARLMLFTKGRANKLSYAAFACRDADALETLRAHVQKQNVAMMPSPSTLFDKRAFAVQDPEGNRMVFGVAETPAVSIRQRGPIHGPLQHVTVTSTNMAAIEEFYVKLGFAVSDRVRNDSGAVTTCFLRSNHEHHTVAIFFKSEAGLDHHSYEAGEWGTIKDWADHLGSLHVPIVWGPGRHGPGNNLFVFIKDTDGNMIEISAELEVVHDRPVKEWKHEPYTLNMWGPAIMRS
jgi:catechol 2,3-dioxygenase